MRMAGLAVPTTETRRLACRDQHKEVVVRILAKDNDRGEEQGLQRQNAQKPGLLRSKRSC